VRIMFDGLGSLRVLSIVDSDISSSSTVDYVSAAPGIHGDIGGGLVRVVDGARRFDSAVSGRLWVDVSYIGELDNGTGIGCT